MEPATSPFLVTSFVWEPQIGRYALTAVALAAARLAHGREATFIDPNGVEPFYDESQALIGRGNLVAPYKPRVDVVVVGHAYAPPGADVDRLLVRVRLGDFSKALSVTGDRLWVREGPRWGSSPPRHFSRMLLVPERALRSAENPVGHDPAAIPVEGRLSLPNFEPAAGSYSAVLGPIPASAPSRRNVLNPAGAHWITALEMGQRPGPVPEGLNFAFFNVAPLDQQLGDVPAGSALVLENLHPREPVFTSRLPPASPAFVAVDPTSGRRLELRARCDTVWVDSDREIVMLVYRATCEVERPDQPFQVRAEIERPPPLPAVPTSGLLVTQQGSLQTAAALPFGGRPPLPGPGSLAASPPSWQRHEMAQAYAAPAAAPASGPPSVRDENTSPLPSKSSYPPPPPRERAITSEIVVPQDQALPFQQTGSADGWDTNTQDLEDTPGAVHETLPPPPKTGADLPFPSAALRPPPPLSGMGSPLADIEPVTSRGPSALARKVLVPRGLPGPVPDIGPTPQPELPPRPEGLVEQEAALDAAPVAIAIPALGKKLGSVGVMAVRPSRATLDAASASEPPPATAPEPEPEPEPVPELPPPMREELDLEECAAVRAELSLKGAVKAEVLERHRLEEATWSRIERAHLKAIDTRAQENDLSLLDRYDDAYVSAQEAHRPPVDEQGYARLQVAKESGRLANVLEELGASRAELMRLDRVWRRKLQADRALAERIEDEIERMRNEG